MKDEGFAERLKRLIAAATPVPWLVKTQNGRGFPGRMFLRASTNDYVAIAHVCQRLERDTNAELIAYLANHASAIAAVVSAAEKIVVPIDHLDGCLFKANSSMPCQCDPRGRATAILNEISAALASLTARSAG